LDLLVEMLEHPGRYEWARVEADDAGFLDDVVALRGAGVIVARQVKFSAHPDDAADPYTWDDFVKERTSEKGNTLLSLLSKWGKSFRELKGAYAGVEATLVSNRRPADDLQNSFAAPGVVDLERITDITVRNSVVAQLGGEENASEFFANFRFQLDLPSLHILEEGILQRFTRLGGDLRAWKNLKDELRKWVRERSSPPPDGRITLAAVKGAARWQQLEALPEAFIVPADFVVPDDGFHQNLIRLLRTTASGCVVVTGPPGIGKSTYISNLYRELRDAETPVIRHHFFLSRDDPTPFRYNHLKVASSLMSELQAISARLNLEVRPGNPRAEELLGWLSDIGGQMSERDSRLVVILDGLDEVWRDADSITELNSLFQLLTPIPPGVILLVGTQPVDASRLPRRLTEVAPRETWLDLPGLEYTAVRQYAEFHASDLRALREAEVDSHRLDELAGALWKRSEGHPLHLRYLLKSLEEVKGYIIARDIERLPDVPHRDITLYYARFWEELSDESKQVLCLLATCDFPWSRTAIAACLDPSRQNLVIDAAIRRVTHLTAEGPLGLQFTHTSLQFFVRQQAEYKNYAPRIREMALEWLRTRAPDFFRWSYEWLLAAEGGDEELLLQGPSRSWLIEGMARRYPTRTADRILTRCAWVALQKGQLDRFVEVALLSDYLSEAVDSRDYVAERLLAPQLAIQEDETIVDRSRGDMNSLGNVELLCLAECCERSGMSSVIENCFDRLNARIRAGQTGRQEAYPRMDAGRCLARVAAFAPKVEPPIVLDWFRSQERTKFARALWEEYTDSLRVHRQTDRLRVAVEGSDDLPVERAQALSCLMLLAWEDGFDPLTEGSQDNSVDPFVVVARALRGETSDSDVTVQVPETWVLRMSDSDFYQHYDEMAEYFWRMFFVFTANSLLGKEDQNLRITERFEDKGWIRGFIDRDATAASNFAQRLRLRQVTKYSWIFTQFSELRQPDFAEDRTGHGFAVAVRKAIFRLAMDLQALQAGTHSPAIDGEDIEAARRMPLFLLHVWMEITVAYRRTWFTGSGLTATLSMIESELGSTVEDFGARAELCALAADLAATHGISDAGSKWVRECWSNLLAFGYHKDMLLDQCLDTADHLQNSGFGHDAQDLLLRLAPAISAVGDYTDGDETRHLPAELGRLLFQGNLHSFVKYHEWLCDRGEYWDAGSILKTFVAKADLSNRVFRAVAETVVERENLSTLAARSDQGDPNATECLGRMSLFRVPESGGMPERDSGSDPQRLTGSGPAPDPADFAPEKFGAYREAVQAAGRYRVDEDIDAWARFWRAQGYKKPVLEALEAYDIDRSLSYGDCELRFALTMEVRGKQAAYEALIEAQKRGYGWNGYFSGPEDVRYVWAKLREFYPERWLAFLQSTLMSDPRNLNRSGVTVHSYISRLVEFLLFMERPNESKKVAWAATETTLQLVPLNLPALTWISGGPSD
jgi:hypothetical protein